MAKAAHPPTLASRTLRERFGALRNLPPFLKLVWRTRIVDSVFGWLITMEK